MRFACLHHGNPFSEALWSGIPLNIVRTLKSLGHEVIPVGPLEPNAPLVARLKTQFYRRIQHRTYLMNRDPATIKARSADGNRRLRELGPVDAVLITYPPDAAYLDCDSPVIILHDAAWADLIDYYPGHESTNLAAETIRGGNFLDRKALNECDRAIYCSEWAASGIIRHYGISPEKVSIAPLGAGVPASLTREDVAASLLLRGGQEMKLLFVGKEWHRKGGATALEVALSIDRMGIPVRLHVAGCEPEGSVPSFVTTHGFLKKDVPREAAQLEELFRTSDFFIMPSRAEAFGIVFAEAAAFGLPLMATDTGGVRENARGEWGMVAPQGTAPSAYAEWAVSLFRNRQEYERRSWLARDAYEQYLNWPAFCRHLVSVAEGCARSNRD